MTRIFLLLLLFTAPTITPALATTLPQEITTPRGISVWYLRDASTPAMTINFAFRGGIEEDAPASQGATHIMAALLTEGTEHLSSTAFQQKLVDYNISFDVNAGREAITGSVRFLLRHHAVATKLAHDALTQPAFRTTDYTRMKQTALAALNNNESDPEWRVQRLAMQQLFGGTPYANAARGTPETLGALKLTDIKIAYQRHITRARLVITAVGAASADETATIIDNIFAGLPQGTAWQATPVTLGGRGAVWYSPWPGSTQNSIVFAAPSVASTASDYAAALVVNDILGGGGFRAVLMDELRQNLGATYGAHAALTPLQATPMMMGQSAVIADKTDDAIGIIKNVWANAPDYLTDDRIAASVTYLSGSLTNDLTSSSAIASYYLGLRLAHLPPDYVMRLPQQLQALSRADILRAANAYYKPDDLSFTIVGPVAPAAVTRTVSNLWKAE